MPMKNVLGIATITLKLVDNRIVLTCETDEGNLELFLTITNAFKLSIGLSNMVSSIGITKETQ